VADEGDVGELNALLQPGVGTGVAGAQLDPQVVRVELQAYQAAVVAALGGDREALWVSHTLGRQLASLIPPSA
jgi:hypothetical protein